MPLNVLRHRLKCRFIELWEVEIVKSDAILPVAQDSERKTDVEGERRRRYAVVRLRNVATGNYLRIVPTTKVGACSFYTPVWLWNFQVV